MAREPHASEPLRPRRASVGTAASSKDAQDGTSEPFAPAPSVTLPSLQWHVLTGVEALARLESAEEGLSSGEAAARIERFGLNALQAQQQVSAWKIFLDQFRSVVVLLLAAAAGVALLLGDPLDAAAVFAVLVINAAVGFFTELKARGAMAALLELEVPRATVLRDGQVRELEARALVPGDVILIEAGQAVPADSRLITATELRVDEAPLTGESVPVDKMAGASVTLDTSLADRVTMIYMSTAVVAGSARAVVVGTGMNTELGRIGGLVGAIKEERTPLELRLDALGRRLVWLALGVTVLVVIVGLLRGEPLGRMLETGLALAIAAVPEGLPAVSTIALAVGVARMARRNALVRRLPAVEALGSATIVCTDKTGTLTAGEMTVVSLHAAGRDYRFSGTGYAPSGDVSLDGEAVNASVDPQLHAALRIGALNNRSALEREGNEWKIRGDPTEVALLVAAAKAGIDRNELVGQWPEVGELPFSSERMLMATFHRGPDGEVVYTKGAPARVIERCSHILTGDGSAPLDAAGRERALDRNRMMASQGLRVLALAEGIPTSRGEEALQGLTLVGFIGMSDPPAPGVRETIDRFRGAGIRTVMITGDQRLTAGAIARELGIARDEEEVLEGRDLRALTPEELDRRIPDVSVLSRVAPEEKLRVIEAFQRRGEIVAMLGDGVNDAAALKKADIGVAMGTRGTDVAKEAASVVLQDDRFQTIGVAVEEGRVIFDNIRKFVFYLFSCNLAEVFVILIAGLVGLPQPLLPLQILWLNLVTDTFPALSLAMEPGQRDVMRRPPRDPDEAILSWPFVRSIGLFGAFITMATLAAFIWALRLPGADPTHAVTIAFMTLALAQTFHLGNARDREPMLAWGKATSNRWAIAAVALTLSLQLLAIYFPPLARLLGVVPLSARDWLVIVPLALFPAVVGQAMALVRKRRRAAGADNGEDKTSVLA